MIEYFDSHQYAFWFTLGFGLLVVEALVFGFTSGVVLFTGIGALLTGGLLWGGVLPASWLNGIACFGVCSSVSAALLWKPLLKFQNFDVPEKDNSSDMVGHKFRLEQDISRERRAARVIPVSNGGLRSMPKLIVSQSLQAPVSW
jgi:membrane protein implicated in regulation of membrane protease activity